MFMRNRLARKMAAEMRGATCAGTQTSKAPTLSGPSVTNHYSVPLATFLAPLRKRWHVKFKNSKIVLPGCSASYDTSTDFLLDKLGWKYLKTQRKIAKGTMVYKALNGLAPNYLAQMFTERSRITNYTLKGTSDKLALPQPRTNYMKNSFSYSKAVLWNSFPIEVRRAHALS